MEGTVPSAQLDKSKVLDVKPLRSLRPVLPSGPQAPPFVCAHPSGPFPTGFSPFYPFSVPELIPDVNQNNTQTPPALFATPFGHVDRRMLILWMGLIVVWGLLLGKNVALLLTAKEAQKIQDSYFSVGISSFERDDGNRQVVMNVLMRFDALRRRISQIEDAKESSPGSIMRADLKPCNVLMSQGVHTNMRKRVGDIPGVEIGDVFFFQMELCLVDLHAQSMSGIDYTIMRGVFEEEPVALSIISSGGYDDVAEDSDVLIYSGQGWNASRKGEQAADQKLERGNLSLERSLRRASGVRVIRGMKETFNQSSKSSKVYIYDGLYTVRESCTEKGKSVCNIFKYKLVRVPRQPGAFSVWKLIQRWKDGLARRVGLILPDISSGAESIPVAIINDVDDENGPAFFTYLTTVKYSKSFRLTSFGCNCYSAC